jgi:hypothetical protein
MTAENFDETLQTLMTRQPFRAFTVELHGGERFEIDSPRVAWSDGKAAAFVGPGGILHIFDNESVLVLSGFVLLAIAAACLAWPKGTPGVTVENAHGIQYGMTLDEVEAILGGPGEPVMDPPGMIWFNMGKKRAWQAGDLTVEVWFFPAGNRFEELNFSASEMGAHWVHYQIGDSFVEIEMPVGDPPTYPERFRYWFRNWVRGMSSPPPASNPVPLPPDPDHPGEEAA